MLVRFRQDVIALKPAVVVIQGGTNDVAGIAGPGTRGTLSDNLMSMTELAKANGIRVVLAVDPADLRLLQEPDLGAIAGADCRLQQLDSHLRRGAAARSTSITTRRSPKGATSRRR